MNIPYRTQRVLNRVGTVLLVLLVVGLIAWLCWVMWLQRYVVYTDEGASLDFSQSSNDVVGEEAIPPVAEANVSIFYNEGANAIDTTNDLKQLSGYYITSDMVKEDYDNVLLQVERLSSGTPVMIEMKGPFGSFYYNTKLSGATISQSTDIAAYEALVSKMMSKGLYTIAQISSLRDREFGLNNVSSGLFLPSKIGLWADEAGMYWLDPTKSSTTTWISQVVMELKNMGFNEVMLADFCFPNSTGYLFEGDKTEALKSAASTLLSTCGSSDFVLSFGVSDPTFTLPGDRCRLYINAATAGNISQVASQVTFEEPEVRLVFLADSGDTRYDEYSVLRSIEIAEEMAARGY